MVKELYQIKEREVSLSINDGVVDSLRRKNITKSGCRVYDGGFLGVAGTLGQPGEAAWRQAEANLSRRLPCPWGPEMGKVRSARHGGTKTDEEFLAQTEQLLHTLRQDFPQFTFSNKMNWMELEIALRNDAGLDYTWRDAAALISILVRAKDSIHIFDTAIGGVYRDFDPAVVLDEARRMLEAHLNPLPMVDAEKMPVLADPSLFSRAWEHGLHSRKLARGASPWADSVGKKLFSADFTLTIDRTADHCMAPFFDGEGTTLEGDRIALIENGILVRGLADKKCAWEHQAEKTASSGHGAYNDVPGLALEELSAAHTGKTLDEILDGRPALYCMTSGGDVTPDGSFASPVQMAYLYQDGKLRGRLPEFAIRGNLQDILGDGYLGCSLDRPFDNQRQMVAEMTIVG